MEESQENLGNGQIVDHPGVLPDPMNAWLLLLFVPFELAFGLTVVGLILNGAYSPIQRAYPDQPVQEPSFRRRFQSLSFGLINAGFCYHITVDDAHLHLTPVRPLRWIGQRAASIPWSEIQLHSKQPFSKRWGRVIIQRQAVVLPTWSIELLKLQP